MGRFAFTSPSARLTGAGRSGRVAAAATALILGVALLSAAPAQAVVVDTAPADQGQPSVTFSSAASGHYDGVALVPGSQTQLRAAGIPTVVSAAGAGCDDPSLSRDLFSALTGGLCWHTGSVLASTRTFAVTWDPMRRAWSTTRQYLEQFLRDVADGSGTLTSPYAVTSQYTDGPLGGANTARAAYSNTYFGGCIDYGVAGGSCEGSASFTGSGHSYPATSNCTGFSPGHGVVACLTDADIRAEVASMATQAGFVSATAKGGAPVVVLFTPEGVTDCLTASGGLCSANASSTAQFCSYHSQVPVQVPNPADPAHPKTVTVTYVVQPWTPLTGCDDPAVSDLGPDPTAQELAINMAQRLASPLSASQIAATVNPGMNGWFAADGSEIDDNGCVPLKNDGSQVGSGGQNPYYLQRESNNGGVIESDPNAPQCALNVELWPTFALPSQAAARDLVSFDGTDSVSTLVVPGANYAWSFGDGTKGAGPSVVHSYAYGGTYPIKLTITDRGGNTAATTENFRVSGPAAPLPPPPSGSGSGTGSTALSVRLQILPESLSDMVRNGLALRVTSNGSADGIVTISIPRAAAVKAHLAGAGSGPVTIGRGTVNGQIKAGTVRLTLKLSSSVASRVGKLGHVTVTVHLALVGAGAKRLPIVAAASY